MSKETDRVNKVKMQLTTRLCHWINMQGVIAESKQNGDNVKYEKISNAINMRDFSSLSLKDKLEVFSDIEVQKYLEEIQHNKKLSNESKNSLYQVLSDVISSVYKDAIENSDLNDLVEFSTSNPYTNLVSIEKQMLTKYSAHADVMQNNFPVYRTNDLTLTNDFMEKYYDALIKNYAKIIEKPINTRNLEEKIFILSIDNLPIDRKKELFIHAAISDTLPPEEGNKVSINLIKHLSSAEKKQFVKAGKEALNIKKNNKKLNNPGKNSASPETKPVPPELKSASPELKSASPETKPVPPELKSASPELKSALPEKKLVIPEKNTAPPELKSASPEKKPTLPKQNPVIHGKNTVSPEPKQPAPPELKSAPPEKKLVIPEKNTVSSEPKQPAPLVKNTISLEPKQPAPPEKKLVIPEKNTVSSEPKQPAPLVKNTISLEPKQPAPPEKKPTLPKQNTVIQEKNAVPPEPKQPAPPEKKPTLLKKNPVIPEVEGGGLRKVLAKFTNIIKNVVKLVLHLVSYEEDKIKNLHGTKESDPLQNRQHANKEESKTSQNQQHESKLTKGQLGVVKAPAKESKSSQKGSHASKVITEQALNIDKKGPSKY